MTADDVNNHFSELLLEVGLKLPVYQRVITETAQLEAYHWSCNEYTCKSVSQLHDGLQVQAIVAYTMSGEPTDTYLQPGHTLEVETALTFSYKGQKWVVTNAEVLQVTHAPSVSNPMT